MNIYEKIKWERWNFEIYSPVVDATTFWYIISLAVHEGLNLHLMDIVTAYLNGLLDNDIYMKISERFKMPEACNLGSREHYSVKLNKFLYRLKQYGHICYNRLSEYLLKHGYKNDTTCPCIFMKRYRNDFIITAVYVDDLSIIGTPEELPKE